MMFPGFTPQVQPPFTPQVQHVQPIRPQPAAPAHTQWQQSQPPSGVARGVSADTSAPFVLPKPGALGISSTLTVSTPVVPAAVDWNQIQARIERLKVLEYKKQQVAPDRVAVRILLPTADPKLAQPVLAEAATEAAAILLALERAEAWSAKR